MKMKMGFISNSSSTSYIAIIPDDFDIDTLNMGKYDEIFDRNDGANATGVRELCRNLLKTTKVYQYDWDNTQGYDRDTFWVLAEVLQEEGCVIWTLDAPPESGFIFIPDQDQKDQIKCLLGVIK